MCIRLDLRFVTNLVVAGILGFEGQETIFITLLITAVTVQIGRAADVVGGAGAAGLHLEGAVAGAVVVEADLDLLGHEDLAEFFF